MIKFSIPLRCLAASSAQLGSLLSSVKWPQWLSTVSILSEGEALDKLRESRNDDCFAFYSSQLKGIVKESHLMSVPIDDFLVHRGYGVYDTAIVRNGKVYELDQHLDRLVASAKRCDLWTDDDFINRPNLRNIILDTIKAAGRRDQYVRYWLGAGCGGLGISKKHCDGPSFYVLTRQYQEYDPLIYEKGVKVITSTIPMKAKLFANIKTTNYLPNALMAVEAESKGAFMGVWIDEDGLVAESAIANVAFIKDKSLLVPTFDKILEGLSIQRIMHLARTQLNMTVIHQPVLFDKVKEYDEAFMCGGNKGPVPIIQWDENLIGDGTVGPWSRKLRELYLEDMDHAFGDKDHLITLSELSG